jgi:uncharacterized RDD family membrane protein YckC
VAVATAKEGEMTDQRPNVGWEAPLGVPGPAPGVQFAPHGDRLLAYILDAIIITLFIVVAVILASLILVSGLSGTGDDTTVSPGAAGTFVAIVVIVGIVATAYFPWFWARGGQTPGMKRFDLWVVRDLDGGAIGWGTALLRFIGMWVSSAVFYLGFAWVLIDNRRRGWHDLIAGTIVVKRV